MQLSEQVPCRSWGTCDIGKRVAPVSGPAYDYSGTVIWPLEFLPRADGIYRGDTGYKWKVYMALSRSRGKHITFELCHDHDLLLRKDWIAIAQEEVNLLEALYAWWARTGL